MHCITCGTPLPAEITACPSCGTATPYNDIHSLPEAASTEGTPAVSIGPIAETASSFIDSQSQTTPSSPTDTERTVLRQQPQPSIAAAAGFAEHTVAQQQPQPSAPATPSFVERTVAQQQIPQPFPGQQPPPSSPGQQPAQPAAVPPFQGQQWPRQMPQPATPPAGPVWQQPQPIPWQPQPFPIWQQPQPGMVQAFPAQQQAPQLIAQVGTAQSLPAQQETRRRGPSLAMLLSLLIVALLIIGASGIIYYAAVGHSAGLHAQATAVAQDFLRAQSPEYIYTQATSGRPAINDPLSKASGSIWNASGSLANGCAFTNGAYHLAASGSPFVTTCFASTNNLSNFAFQVQMTVTQGLAGGLLLRIDNTQSSFYIFFIQPEGFYRFALLGTTNNTVLSFSHSAAIKAGLGQQNLLTAIAHDSNIYLYINKQYVTTIHDSTLKSGGIGLIGEGGPNLAGDVSFSNAQVWKQ